MTIRKPNDKGTELNQTMNDANKIIDLEDNFQLVTETEIQRRITLQVFEIETRWQEDRVSVESVDRVRAWLRGKK